LKASCLESARCANTKSRRPEAAMVLASLAKSAELRRFRSPPTDVPDFGDPSLGRSEAPINQRFLRETLIKGSCLESARYAKNVVFASLAKSVTYVPDFGDPSLGRSEALINQRFLRRVIGTPDFPAFVVVMGSILRCRCLSWPCRGRGDTGCLFIRGLKSAPTKRTPHWTGPAVGCDLCRRREAGEPRSKQ